MVRIPFKQRLEYLDITQEHFEFYVELFVKQYTRYWKRYENSGWFQMQHRDTGGLIPLTKYEVVRFLAGEFWLCKAMAGQNDFFCIDLDNKCGTVELYERYKLISNVLPGPLVIQSSSSYGLHLYYFFSTDYWRPNIKKYLAELLAANGIQIERGYVEPFPGIITQMRLPLGKDSILLDPVTLDPLNLTLRESIEYCGDFKAENAQEI